MKFFIDIYDLGRGEYAHRLSRTTLDLPSKEDALKTVKAVRSGLPPHCAASLIHEDGWRNVYP